MKERIVGNWLTKASERSFQIPFAYMLANKGYEVVHVSRHCAMELGKDVLAIDSNGIPCAYQLKGKPKIKLNDWRNELNQQALDLTMLPIEHPSILSDSWHISYLVVNGELEEEVTEAINKFNRAHEKRYGDKSRNLNVITYGSLFSDAISMGSDLWPTELKDIKTLLEIILKDENDVFPIPLYIDLLNSHFRDISESTSKQKLKRLISSASLLTSLCCSEYTNQNNYYAEILCWSTYLNKIYEITESIKIEPRFYKTDLNLTIKIISNSYSIMSEEIISLENHIVGNLVEDTFVYRQRMLLLIGIIAINGLNSSEENQNRSFEFIKQHFNSLAYWGESSISYIIPIYLFLKLMGDSVLAIKLIKVTTETILLLASNESRHSNPSPYYSLEDCLLQMSGQSEYKFKETFNNRSYILNSLISILIRNDEREFLEENWKQITRITQLRYDPINYSEFFRYNSENGTNNSVILDFPSSWRELKSNSKNLLDLVLPKRFRENQIKLLWSLLILPQRYNKDICIILDEKLKLETKR